MYFFGICFILYFIKLSSSRDLFYIATIVYMLTVVCVDVEQVGLETFEATIA